jgi:hypothetical protein
MAGVNFPLPPAPGGHRLPRKKKKAHYIVTEISRIQKCFEALERDDTPRRRMAAQAIMGWW